MLTGRCGLVKVLRFAQDDRQRKGESLAKEGRDLVNGGNLVGTGCGYLVDGQAFLFLLKKSGDPVDDLIQRSTGAEASKGVELFDGGPATHHVLKAGFVGLVVGH